MKTAGPSSTDCLWAPDATVQCHSHQDSRKARRAVVHRHLAGCRTSHNERAICRNSRTAEATSRVARSTVTHSATLQYRHSAEGSTVKGPRASPLDLQSKTRIPRLPRDARGIAVFGGSSSALAATKATFEKATTQITRFHIARGFMT